MCGTVCMPKAKCAFRRSNPFELKLCESQDQCNIRAHTKFQLPKCRWSLMTMGQSRGIFVVKELFVRLKLKLKVNVNAHGNETRSGRTGYLLRRTSYSKLFYSQSMASSTFVQLVTLILVNLTFEC